MRMRTSLIKVRSMAEIGQHAQGVHPSRACPAFRIEDQLPRVSVGGLEEFPKLLAHVTFD